MPSAPGPTEARADRTGAAVRAGARNRARAAAGPPRPPPAAAAAAAEPGRTPRTMRPRPASAAGAAAAAPPAPSRSPPRPAARPRPAAALGGAGRLPAAGARCPSSPRPPISTPAPPTSTIPRSPSRSAPRRSASAAAGLLGALTQIGGGTASDADILFDYIRSQEIVAAVDARLDLRTIWNRPGSGWRDGDPVFTLGDDPSIEALHAPVAAHGRRSPTTPPPASSTSRARAFTPEDARAIAAAILDEIERAGEPALRPGARGRGALRPRRARRGRGAPARGARHELADFRREHSIVDPSADVAGQSGLLNALNAELAQALVERDVLLSYAGEGDQRVIQADRRIDAITERIEDERRTLGVTGVAGTLPEVVGRYEELAVDLEFANTAYTQTLAGLAAARAEARRQSRYLAAHVQPTLADHAALPAPGAARRPDRAVPAARLGHR